MKKVLFPIALMIGVLMNAQGPTTGVSVSGEGTVYVKPDQVILNIGVEHTGDYVMKVKQQTEAAVDNIIDFLKSKDVPEENIQTQYVRLGQQYEYKTKTYHYSSRQAISIKLENIGNYEEILTGLMEAGVNRINGVNFLNSEVETYQAQARVKAVQNAKAKAEDYAGALGQRIGKALAITDVSSPRPRFDTAMAFKAMSGGGSGNQDSIAPGQLAITAHVNVRFRLY